MSKWIAPITGTLSALVLIATAWAAYDDIRPWPTRAEFIDVAATSLTTAINQNYDLLTLERRELRLCEKSGQDCTTIQRRIQRLEQRIRQLEAKRAKVGG